MVTIPKTFLYTSASNADIIDDDPEYHIDLGNLHDDETIVAGSKTKTYRLNKVHTTIFYDDSPQA